MNPMSTIPAPHIRFRESGASVADGKDRVVSWSVFLPGFVEVVLIFAVFAIYGMWPIPDSNEPYYIGKAIHYWQPDWVVGDTFLDSKDAHWFFYVTFGLLALVLGPAHLAWVGRLICWGLMAWSWRRLSRAMLPIWGAAIITASAFLCFNESFHMAGEWVAGGVEGKTFAYPFVFLGLEAAVRSRWRSCWIFLGIASAFHPLVGGWSVLCGLFAFLTLPPSRRPTLLAIFPGLVLGGLLSLPGLLPVLLLNRGAEADIIRQANETYVYLRLHHHLVPSMLPWALPVRFLLFTAVWLAATRLLFREHRKSPGDRHDKTPDTFAPYAILTRFVFGAILLATVGFFIDALLGCRFQNKPLAAGLLRFYWFRTSDWAVPAGAAFVGLLLIQKYAPLRALAAVLSRSRKLPGTPSVSVFRATLPWIAGRLFLVAFAAYLLIDYACFGLNFSWDKTPDKAVPWCGVLLLFFVAALLFPRRGKAFRLELGLVLAVLMFVFPAVKFSELGDLRTRFAYSRIEPAHPIVAYYWHDACSWIREHTPREAVFLVPRQAATFKWNTRRSDVANWKDVPQDAEGIVRWRETVEELYSRTDEDGKRTWDSLPARLWRMDDAELLALRDKYDFDYVVCRATIDPFRGGGRKPSLKMVYNNQWYAVYRVAPG